MPEGQATRATTDDLDAAQKRRAESDAADRVLVTKAQAGDRAALGELLHKHGAGLYRSVLLPRLGSEAAAKEALSETYAKVEEALARINPRYSRAIRLRVLDERPRDEVAAELGVTPSTFDVLLHRAIASLKKALGERGEASEKDDE